MTQPNAIEAAQAKELAALREQVTEFKKVNDELKITLQKQIEINAEQQVIIKTQRDQIDLLLRQKFGKSSEAMDAEQLVLLLQGDEAKKPDASEADVSALEAEIKRGEAEIAAARREERKRKTVRIPEHLPVIERIEIDPEEVKADPEAWRCIGEEVTEQIAMKRDGMGRRQIVRRKWVKKDEPHKAPSSARSTPCKSAASPHPASWPTSSTPSIASTCHSTGWRRCSNAATTCASRARRCAIGWG